MRGYDKDIKRFIDFDKDSEMIYVNYYMDEFNLVLKVPIINNDEDIRIDKSILSNYT